MSAFDILGLTGGTAGAGGAATSAGERKVELIPLEDIIPAKNNNYGIRDIEPLAESIQADGLLSPLNVRFMEDNGKYEIISGERRYTAFKHLRDKGIAGYDAAPCLVERDVSDLQAEIRLIRANSTTRVQTDPERVKNAARPAVLIDQLKGAGVKVPGRKRENIADALGTSTAQVGRMESIEKNLIPEAKAEFERGGLNFSTAYETSLLPPDKQADVVEGLKSGEKEDIKSVKERRRPPAAPPASAPEPPVPEDAQPAPPEPPHEAAPPPSPAPEQPETNKHYSGLTQAHIKQCPFCGGEAHIIKSRFDSGRFIECAGCGARSKGVAGHLGHEEAQAVALWNRRHDEGGHSDG